MSIKDEFEILIIIILISDLLNKLISIIVPSNKEEENDQIENLKFFTTDFLPTPLDSLEKNISKIE